MVARLLIQDDMSLSLLLCRHTRFCTQGVKSREAGTTLVPEKEMRKKPSSTRTNEGTLASPHIVRWTVEVSARDRPPKKLRSI